MMQYAHGVLNGCSLLPAVTCFGTGVLNEGMLCDMSSEPTKESCQ